MGPQPKELFSLQAEGKSSKQPPTLAQESILGRKLMPPHNRDFVGLLNAGNHRVNMHHVVTLKFHRILHWCSDPRWCERLGSRIAQQFVY